MEQTLGKRIIENRKRLGLTQDKLAERLGVTAQAVSKWENDQSCPDITTLPKLAEIFGITTDELLGISRETAVREAEVLTEENVQEEPKGTWELKYDSGRRGGIAMAAWVLLSGGLLLASNILGWNADLWDICWPAGLLVFGLWGVWPKFSFFRLSCGILGGYYLITNLGFAPFTLDKQLLLPIFLLLLGLNLLVEALKKKKPASFHIVHNGHTIHHSNRRKNTGNYSMDGESFDGFTGSCDISDESFDCCTSFGSNQQEIILPLLRSGSAEINFGELEVDLSGCEAISEDCDIDAECNFGQLTFLVPRRYRVETATETACGSVEISGHPASDPVGVIRMDCEANFGQITIRYI